LTQLDTYAILETLGGSASPQNMIRRMMMAETSDGRVMSDAALREVVAFWISQDKEIQNAAESMGFGPADTSAAMAMAHRLRVEARVAGLRQDLDKAWARAVKDFTIPEDLTDELVLIAPRLELKSKPATNGGNGGGAKQPVRVVFDDGREQEYESARAAYKAVKDEEAPNRGVEGLLNLLRKTAGVKVAARIEASETGKVSETDKTSETGKVSETDKTSETGKGRAKTAA
jgi:hypothetical protein